MDVWMLDPHTAYVIDRDDQVRPLMRQLGVPNLFAGTAEFDAIKALVAFDNHPSHWIIIRLWQGMADYSPNHSVNKMAQNPSPNGLLFEAVPKADVSRETIKERLINETLRMGAHTPFEFQQLPKSAG